MAPIVTASKTSQHPNLVACVAIKHTEVRSLDNQRRKHHQRAHLKSKAESHNSFIPILPGRNFVRGGRKSAAQAHSDELKGCSCN